MRKIKHFYLSAQTKILAGLVCSVFLFILSSLSAPEAKAQCVSYATCHFYNGSGAATCTDPRAPIPVQDCTCWVYTKQETGLPYDLCVKSQNNVCDISLDSCAQFNKTGVTCPSQYRSDCCGCSGKPKPLPTATPKPTPTPTSACQKGCNQICQSDAECAFGLKCGYNVVWGGRRCSNPSCPLATDCKCSWQK